MHHAEGVGQDVDTHVVHTNGRLSQHSRLPVTDGLSVVLHHTGRRRGWGHDPLGHGSGHAHLAL